MKMNKRVIGIGIGALGLLGLLQPLHASTSTVLLDNTGNLSTANLSTSSATGYGSNSTAYNRINGYVFVTGESAFELDSVSIGMRYGPGTISPTLRVTLWELGASATTPSGVSPFYTEDFTVSDLSSVARYCTFSPGSSVVLEEGTRYAIGFSTDWTTSSSSLQWLGFSPTGTKPVGSEGFSSLSGGSGFFSTNAGSSYSTATMVYSFQLTGSAVGGAIPEPSAAAALAGVGALCAVTASRRRRR